MPAPVKIAILASGTGTNADRICAHFAGHPSIVVALIVSNKADAGVLEVAERHKVPATVIGNAQLSAELLTLLQQKTIDFVVLAGFLRPVPADVVAAFSGRIVNIHPALLPKFGGKGMYGAHVHRAVIDAGETESGITIHNVNEKYDEGAILFQAKCPVRPEDTPDTLAQRIHGLEHRYYPGIIEQQIQGQKPPDTAG